MDSIGKYLDASLKELVDVKYLMETISRLFDLYKVPLRIFDEKNNLFLEKSHGNDLCEYFSTSETGKNTCTSIRGKIKNLKIQKEKYLRIHCPLGLEYLVSPIGIDEKIMGKIVLGPYISKDEKKKPLESKINEFSISYLKIQKIRKGLLGHKDSKMKRFVAAVRSVVNAILISSHKAYLTSEMHIATVRESYKEIAGKNRELEEMTERMKEFDRVKSNFLSTVSHELRTPLTSIIGYSDMLSEGIAGDLGKEQLQFIETIRTKGEELLNLISSILDFQILDSGRIDLNLRKNNASHLLKEVVDICMPVSIKRGTKLSVQVAQDIPEVVFDHDKIQSAIRHLIDNAIKFSSPGAVVTVSARVIPARQGDVKEEGIGFVLMADPDMLEIAVTDHGTGIAKSDQIKIFSPFTQLDNSSTRESGGAGLGLAIVKQYVETHGGRVKVKSNPEEGSRFAILLPVLDIED